jgi:hypothetical protein
VGEQRASAANIASGKPQHPCQQDWCPYPFPGSERHPGEDRTWLAVATP